MPTGLLFFRFLATTPATTGTVPIIDIVLGLLLAIGLINGLRKGFIVEIASLIALVLGVYGAIHFSYYLVDILHKYLSWNEQYINITALVLTFIIIVVAVLLLAKFFTRLAKLMALGFLNRLFGGIFGLIKIGFILGVFLLYFNQFNSQWHLINSTKIENSVLYAPLKKFGAKIFPSVMEQIKMHAQEVQKEKHSSWSNTKRPVH